MFDFPDSVEYMIMESAEEADRAIEAFKEVIRHGNNPENCEQEVYETYGINPEIFTDYDKNRILTEINEFMEEYNA